MQKDLEIKMEKVYDFPDGETSKYDILAYFKQQEAVKNKLENAMIEDAMIEKAQTANQSNANKYTAAQVSVNCPHPNNVTTGTIDMSVTNLLLFNIAFFLFVLLIIHD